MESLQGSLLIAGPSLVDPNFRRTVVLVAEHGPEGAMGLVLNRPSALVVADAVPHLAELVPDDDPVWFGGPVDGGAVVAVGDFEQPGEAAALIMGRVGFLPAEADAALLAGAVRRTRVYAGYAGWDSGQLETELEEDSWIVEPALPEDVFYAEGVDLWSCVLRRKGGRFRLLATMPVDPSLN